MLVFFILTHLLDETRDNVVINYIGLMKIIFLFYSVMAMQCPTRLCTICGQHVQPENFFIHMFDKHTPFGEEYRKVMHDQNAIHSFLFTLVSCETCGKQVSKMYFAVHNHEFHLVKNVYYQCYRCEQVEATFRGILQHLMVKHQQTNGDVLYVYMLTRRLCEPYIALKYCPHCEFKSVSDNVLSAHINSVHP